MVGVLRCYVAVSNPSLGNRSCPNTAPVLAEVQWRQEVASSSPFSSSSFFFSFSSSPTLYHHQTSLYLVWASPSWQLKIQMAFSYSRLIIYFRAHDYGIIFFFFFSLSFVTQTNKTTCPLHMHYLFKNTSHNSGIITKVIITKVSKKALASHSSTLAWKIPWMEEPGGLQSMGSLRVRHNWLHFHFSLSCVGEGNGNPLQCSCLENPRVGAAWWTSVYGVAQSRTLLKWLSSSSRSN